MSIINLTKNREERLLRDLANKLSSIGHRVLEICSKDDLTIAETDQLIRIVLPGMLKDRVDRIIMAQKVESILKDAVDNIKNNLS